MYAKAISSLAQWLCPTKFDRKRAVDAGVRVRRARMTVGLLIGSATLVLIPRLGWLPLAFFAVQSAYLAGLEGRMEHSEHPEIQAAAGMLSTGIAMTAGIVVTGGPDDPVASGSGPPDCVYRGPFRRPSRARRRGARGPRDRGPCLRDGPASGDRQPARCWSRS